MLFNPETSLSSIKNVSKTCVLLSLNCLTYSPSHVMNFYNISTNHCTEGNKQHMIQTVFELKTEVQIKTHIFLIR